MSFINFVAIGSLWLPLKYTQKNCGDDLGNFLNNAHHLHTIMFNFSYSIKMKIYICIIHPVKTGYL